MLSTKEISRAKALEQLIAFYEKDDKTEFGKCLIQKLRISLVRLRQRQARRRNLQSRQARILLQAWMFQHIPRDTERKKPGYKKALKAAARRLKPKGLTLSDISRTSQKLFASGYVEDAYAFARAEEVVKDILLPMDESGYDEKTISILCGLLTDIVGCESIQEISEQKDLGYTLIDGTMGMPSEAVELQKQVRAMLAERPRSAGSTSRSSEASSSCSESSEDEG
jgi:hypothetical protein